MLLSIDLYASIMDFFFDNYRLSSEVIADEEVDRTDVFHTGMVIFTRPFIYQSPCKVDMENFPYDVQSCSMRFGSWMYTKEELDMVGHTYSFLICHVSVHFQIMVYKYDMVWSINFDICIT